MAKLLVSPEAKSDLVEIKRYITEELENAIAAQNVISNIIKQISKLSDFPKMGTLHSLSAQISYYSEMIQNRRDWEYAGVYVDKAVTGTKSNRTEFQKMIKDCKDGKIDMIITKSISRFARNTVTMLETVRELKSLGIDVYFEKENIHSMSGDGELMLTIL